MSNSVWSYNALVFTTELEIVTEMSVFNSVKNWCPIPSAFKSPALCSRDTVQIHWNPDRDEELTEDE